jgi:hypothetical protein
MGLLDDAIREHLELKRQRGADPDEVARQQDEALGDPRSGEFAKPAGEGEPAAVAHDVESEPEPLADEPQPLEEDLPPEPPAHAAFEPEREPAEPPDAPWLEDDPPAAIAAEQALEEPQRQQQPPPADGDEDVLEETPEFLQETPEHDRLWFEQKPPRDFDFDN